METEAKIRIVVNSEEVERARKAVAEMGPGYRRQIRTMEQKAKKDDDEGKDARVKMKDFWKRVGEQHGYGGSFWRTLVGDKLPMADTGPTKGRPIAEQLRERYENWRDSKMFAGNRAAAQTARDIQAGNLVTPGEHAQMSASLLKGAITTGYKVGIKIAESADTYGGSIQELLSGTGFAPVGNEIASFGRSYSALKGAVEGAMKGVTESVKLFETGVSAGQDIDPAAQAKYSAAVAAAGPALSMHESAIKSSNDIIAMKGRKSQWKNGLQSVVESTGSSIRTFFDGITR